MNTQTILWDFDRSDSRLTGGVKSDLRPKYRYKRCYRQEEFLKCIQDIRDDVKIEGDPKLHHLRTDLDLNLGFSLYEIAQKIHQEYHVQQLEYFLAEVLKKVPYVEDVRNVDAGGASGHGADLKFDIWSDFDEKPRVAVAQVKSYEGDMWHTQAVEDLRKAFKHHKDAQLGIIFGTARSTPKLQEAVDKLQEELDAEGLKESNAEGKKVKVFAGADLAAFVLKYYGEEILWG
ncbi:MAG: restriction endonuclease [Cytophagales bacterium]|nr:restriction endonuclease [Cytophagales bacterium]